MNEHLTISDNDAIAEQSPSAREQEVLSVVLDLMVEEGDGFSMASVARRASCSKETLYRWYGDRDGLLTATVQWQASKVAMPILDDTNLTLSAFSRTLRDFASSWLTVLTSDVSIALNRLAVSHAGNNKSSLGRIVLENGPYAMRTRLLPIFLKGQKAELIDVRGDEAFRLFFGLVIADVQIRALLGDEKKPTRNEIQEFAQKAVDQFLSLCGKQQNQ
jgi:AcrR family transcriptional regulator